MLLVVNLASLRFAATEVIDNLSNLTVARLAKFAFRIGNAYSLIWGSWVPSGIIEELSGIIVMRHRSQTLCTAKEFYARYGITYWVPGNGYLRRR